MVDQKCDCSWSVARRDEITFSSSGMPHTFGLLATRIRTSVAASTLPWIAIVPFLLFITGRFEVHSSSGDVQVGYPFQLTLFRTRVVSESGVHWVHPTISTATWIIGGSTMFMDALYSLTLLVLIVGLGRCATASFKRRDGIVARCTFSLGCLSPRWLYSWPCGSPRVSHGWFAPERAKFSVCRRSLRGRGAHGQLHVGRRHWRMADHDCQPGRRCEPRQRATRNASLRSDGECSDVSIAHADVPRVSRLGVAVELQNRESHVAGAIVATYPRHDVWLPMAFALGFACVASIRGATTARRSWRIIYSQRLWDT